jgi:uridine kinase
MPQQDADEVRRHRPGKTAAVDERVRRYDDLARDLLAIDAGVQRVRLVGVDGCGAAGKTTFAARLARAAGDAPVVHTDDFSSFDEPMHWWPRMLAEVIEPLTRGDTATFHPYDWVRSELSPDTIAVPPAPLVVIEGVGATRDAWRDRLVARIWVDAPREVRLRRGLERDGAHMHDFWQWWMSEEDRYIATEHPDERPDLRVDGDSSVPHDPESEFVEVGVDLVSERR